MPKSSHKRVSNGIVTTNLPSLCMIGLVASFILVQMMLLPSSPLQCQVSPHFTQKLKGDSIRNGELFMVNSSNQQLKRTHNKAVPVGSRLRLGYFHLLPESIAEYFGLRIPNPKDEQTKSGTKQTLELENCSTPSKHRRSQKCDDVVISSLGEDQGDIDVNSLQDIFELVDGFRDFMTTASLGALVCTATVSSEWIRHISSGIPHQDFLVNGLRAIFPKSDFKQLDERFGSCGTLIEYLDRNIDMARIILAYFILCMVVYLGYTATASKLSPSFNEDNQEDENEHPVKSNTSKPQNVSPVKSSPKLPKLPSPVKSLIDDSELNSNSNIQDAYDDIDDSGSSHFRGNKYPVGVITPRFKSPARSPKTRSRIARRRRELLVAVGSLLAQHKRMKSQRAHWTPNSRTQIDRGALSEGFIERVHNMTTPARSRLEARVEQRYEKFDEVRQDFDSSMSQDDIETQYYSELLSGIDIDDEPPVRLVDDASTASSAHTKGYESLIVDSPEMKELNFGHEPDRIKVDDFAFGALPAVSDTPELTRSIHSTDSPASKVVKDLNISAFDELSDLQVADEGEKEEQISSPVHEGTEEKETEIRKLRLKFEGSDLSKALNAIVLIEHLAEVAPSTLIYNGELERDREDSSTVLWFAARSCYISVQELEQIQKRIESGDSHGKADPNDFTVRLSRARVTLHALYSSALAESIVKGAVEPYSPEFFENLSNPQFWAYIGLKFAYISVAENERSANAHKWVAISADKVGQVTDRKTRIVNAKIFLKHTTRATELNPNDPVLYHMLGRFEFEIASLAWWQRAAAAALFGTLPECKMADSQGNLERAKELRPLWPLNLLYLARAYRANGENDECLSILDDLVSMIPNTTEDEISIGEAVTLRHSLL